MIRTIACIGALVTGSLAAAQEMHLPLGDGWTVRQEGAPDFHAARVPGTVQADLLRDGSIPDPWMSDNSDSARWVASCTWVYERTIDAGPELLDGPHVDLVFRGIDTFGEVRLNGAMLGRTDNMFRTWRFPIRDHLRPGPNRLQVVILPVEVEGRARREESGLPLPHDSDPSGVSPFVRKSACDFGWDFSPPMRTCGIWQPVEIHAWHQVRIGGVRIEQALAGDAAVVGVEVDLEGRPTAPLHLVLDIDGDRTMAPVGPGDTAVRASLSIADARRWWPAGSGEQVLYPLRVELMAGGTVLSSWEERIGLRTIALDRHAGAFAFLVNDVPVFMRGANLVPPDRSRPGWSDADWIDLVRHARRAHMNMLRVWAGGIYPPDAFFEACDTAGILVWQDLMFAQMVPDDRAFLANVRAETIDQVARISHHSSLALWCGNNELEVAWNNWGWQQRYAIAPEDSARIWNGYSRLFEREMPGWIASLSAVPYVASSPSSNWGNAAGLTTGDLHYWGVWHGDSAFSSFRGNVGRFVSEYGFQSHPDSTLLARYVDPSQLTLGSEALARRQRSYKTDRPIMEAIAREFGAVPRTLGEFIGYGQLVQAEALRAAIWAHRTRRPHCMGTLFWQMNDRWPLASWSAIDVEGDWKPAMLEVRRGFAPIVLDLERVGEGARLQAWNEGAAIHARLIIRRVHTDRTVISSDTLAIHLPSGLSTPWSSEGEAWKATPDDRELVIAELETGAITIARALPRAGWAALHWSGNELSGLKALQASPLGWMDGRSPP